MATILLNDGPLCSTVFRKIDLRPNNREIHFPDFSRGFPMTAVVYKRTDMVMSDGTIIYDWVPGEGKGELR